MAEVRLGSTLVGVLVIVSVLSHCAAVHDATPKSCAADQEPSGGLCVCATTLSAPVDGSCPSASCATDDCVDDGNPCTEATPRLLEDVAGETGSLTCNIDSASKAAAASIR